MAGQIGDLLFNIMGQPDPRQKLAAALAGNSQPQGSPNLAATVGQPGTGGGASGPPNPDTAQAPPGAPQGPPQQQQQQAPPQPQAYTSTPDMVQLAMQLQDRQQANESINRGFGLMAAGLTNHPEDRQMMVNAMTGNSGPPAMDQINSMATLQDSMMKRNLMMQTLQSLPAIGAKYGWDPATTMMLYNTGKLGDAVEAVQKERLPSTAASTAETIARTGAIPSTIEHTKAETGAIPSTIAKTQADTAEAIARTGAIPSTVAKTQAETGLASAQTGAIPFNIAKTQAETGAIPFNIAKTQAETGAIPSQISKTIAETSAIAPSIAKTQAETSKIQQDVEGRKKLMENIPAIAKVTGLSPEVLNAMPPDDIAKLTVGAMTPTTGQKEYTGAMAQLPPGAAKPSFDEWTAAQSGLKEAASQSSLLQTQQKMSAQAALPDAIAKVRDQLRIADEVTKDMDALKGVTGWKGTKMGNVLATLPGTAGATLQSKIEQLTGATGVSAVESLKGVGRVLGTEYTAGTDAQSRLHQQDVSAEDYRTAINDYGDKLKTQLAITMQKAGMPVPGDLLPFLPDSKTGQAGPGTARKGHYDAAQHKVIYD